LFFSSLFSLFIHYMCLFSPTLSITRVSFLLFFQFLRYISLLYFTPFSLLFCLSLSSLIPLYLYLYCVFLSDSSYVLLSVHLFRSVLSFSLSL
jgi:hypothetical protein